MQSPTNHHDGPGDMVPAVHLSFVRGRIYGNMTGLARLVDNPKQAIKTGRY